MDAGLNDLSFYHRKVPVFTRENSLSRPANIAVLQASLNKLRRTLSKGSLHEIEALTNTIFGQIIRQSMQDLDLAYAARYCSNLLESYGIAYQVSTDQPVPADYPDLDEYLQALNTAFQELLKNLDGLKRYSPDVVTVLTELTRDPCREFSLAELADSMGVSISRLSNTFNKETGQSIPQTLSQLRVGYACRLLETTGLKIEEIAIRSGFPNLKYFNQIFKKIMDCSPSAWRKDHS